MKIKLLRASNTIKEIEFAMTLPSIDIHRLSVDLLFENFPGGEADLRGAAVGTGAEEDVAMILADADLIGSSL